MKKDNVIKIADFLMEKIDCTPKGDVIFFGNREAILALIEKRIFDISQGVDCEKDTKKVSADKELIFLENILKRFPK